LAAPPSVGRPRQADLRRAISSAYYGLFHFVLTCVADEFVGITQRATSRYTLVYRSVDHRTLKELCIEARKQTPIDRYFPYVPLGGFGADIQQFATVTIDLQARRHIADYDPRPRFQGSDATLAIGAARNAIGCFAQASRERRTAFLTLLLCPPR
jgi:hypothetical protein